MSQAFPAFGDDEFLEDDWCAFGTDDADFDDDNDGEEDEVIDWDDSQDLSCDTNKSPVDAMGFPIQQQQNQQPSKQQQQHTTGVRPRAPKRRSKQQRPPSNSSSELERRIGQEVHVSRSRQPTDDASKTSASSSRSTNSAQRRLRMQRRTRSLDGTKEPLLPPAGRQSVRRSKSGVDTTTGIAKGAVTALAAGGRRAGSRRHTTTAIEVESRKGGSGARRQSETTSESIDDKAKRMKDLALAFQAASILQKGAVTRTDHLKGGSAVQE